MLYIAAKSATALKCLSWVLVARSRPTSPCWSFLVLVNEFDRLSDTCWQVLLAMGADRIASASPLSGRRRLSRRCLERSC